MLGLVLAFEPYRIVGPIESSFLIRVSRYSHRIPLAGYLTDCATSSATFASPLLYPSTLIKVYSISILQTLLSRRVPFYPIVGISTATVLGDHPPVTVYRNAHGELVCPLCTAIFSTEDTWERFLLPPMCHSLSYVRHARFRWPMLLNCTTPCGTYSLRVLRFDVGRTT